MVFLIDDIEGTRTSLRTEVVGQVLTKSGDYLGPHFINH